MRGQYKYVIVISLLLWIAPARVLSRTLQDDIAELSKTRDVTQFSNVLQKINFKDIFNNETVKESLAPKYKNEYLEMVANTGKLVEIIDVDSLMLHFHTKQNMTNMTFLKMVLKNIDALKAVNLVDWSTFIMQSNGGKAIFSKKRSNGYFKTKTITFLIFNPVIPLYQPLAGYWI